MSSTAITPRLSAASRARPHRPLDLVERSPHASSPDHHRCQPDQFGLRDGAQPQHGAAGSRRSTTLTSRASSSSAASSAITRRIARERIGLRAAGSPGRGRARRPSAVRPSRTSPRMRAAIGAAASSSVSASATCASGAVARRSAAGRAGAARLSTSATRTPRVVEQLQPVVRAPDRDRDRARSRGSPARRRPARGPGARSTAASASTRSRTAATSTSSELTGSVTKDASRIASARSALTSGTVDLGDQELRPVDQRLAQVERRPAIARARRSNSAASVQTASRRRAASARRSSTSRRNDGRSHSRVQPVAQPRRRRVAARPACGWRSTGGTTRPPPSSARASPKDMPQCAACSGASEVGVMPGWVLVSRRMRPVEAARCRPSGSPSALTPRQPSASVGAQRVVEAGGVDLARHVGGHDVARAAGRVFGVIVVPALGDDVGDRQRAGRPSRWWSARGPGT